MVLACRRKTGFLVRCLSCSPANAYFPEPQGGAIPGAVREAFGRAHPDANAAEMHSRMDRGELSYEVEYLDTDGRRRRVLYSLLGGVIRRGEVIAPADLPKSVLTRVGNRSQKARLHKVSTILDNSGILSGYELDLSVGGKMINVALDTSEVTRKSATE